MDPDPLQRTVTEIEAALARRATATAREPLWTTHYGAFHIHPRHLAYWICVATDAERDRLAGDPQLGRDLREVLVTHGYPAEGRPHVHIGFESQETVDREADGDWFHHWK